MNEPEPTVSKDALTPERGPTYLGSDPRIELRGSGAKRRSCPLLLSPSSIVRRVLDEAFVQVGVNPFHVFVRRI